MDSAKALCLAHSCKWTLGLAAGDALKRLPRCRSPEPVRCAALSLGWLPSGSPTACGRFSLRCISFADE